MNIETYKEAKRLVEDMEAMDIRIKDANEYNSLTVSTLVHYGRDFSSEFSNEIFDWLKSKKEEYQKKLDELR